MNGLIRRCPKCKEARPLNEIICQATGQDGTSCAFPLINVRPTPNGAMRLPPSKPAAPEPNVPQPGPTLCPNGHNIEEGDRICVTCGAQIGAAATIPEPTPPETPRRIEDWTILETLEDEPSEAVLYRVRSDENATPRLLRFFAHGVEPETRTYPAIKRLNTPRVASLVATGRTEERAYEVWDEIDAPTLASRLGEQAFSPGQVRDIVRQVAEALAALESHNLRHGNLNPTAIRLRSSDPIDLQIGELSTSTLAEFNLEIARVRPLTRYLSPETIVGTSSQTSDWWGLGIILLELLTNGRCFEHVNDRAFLLHVVARSLDLPTDLGADWALLLKGLLTRDHDKRWRGMEVERWLAGDRDIPVHFETVAGGGTTGPALSLGGKPYRDARSFALAAAQAENWDEALALTEMGTVATWLSTIDPETPGLKRFKQLMEERRLERDYRFALALLALNEHLPLSLRGDIQTPNRFLEQPAEAAPWFEKVSINALVQLKRESWIVRLADRVGRIRARAEELGISLVEDRFRVARLAAFESRLEEFWRQRRQIFPDSATPGLAALLERRSLTDEDLILLICADDLSFRSSEQVIAEATSLAREIDVNEFDVDVTRDAFALSKRELIDEIEERIGAFKRTARQRLDDWADSLRLGRRLPLAQLLVLRAVPESQWQEPPHQDYLRNVLEFLQKKILSNLQRGPLVKLIIGRSASRIDVTDLGERSAAQTLIERALSRDDQPLSLSTVSTTETREKFDRLKRIAKAADLYRRETGVSALVLAFPLVTFDDRSLTGASSIRIAPLALWPLKLKVQGGLVSISYDGERDPEINPALERVLGVAAANAWRGKFDAMLRDGVERIPELIAAFRDLAPDADPLLRPIPDQTEIKGQYRPKLVAAGAFMLADFPSRAIVEDLRAIQGKPMSGTVLECLLRITEAQHAVPLLRPREEERFTTLDADPSQEEAVLAARQVPGLKLEGPPGTGKSQTIVNIITDCIGRGESVMLVCEKQVALEVVHKRLRAEGLDRRAVRIENTQSDRGRLLGELQAQIPQVIQTPVGTHNNIRTQRQETASTIDKLEADLNTYHEAVYVASNRLGLSYRDVVARIAAHERAAKGLSAPNLRSILGVLTPSQVERTTSECLSLLEAWHEADFTDDTLNLFRVFASDPALEARLAADFKCLSIAENERRAAIKIAAPITGFPAEIDPNAIALWRTDHEAQLKSLSGSSRRVLSAWRNVLKPKEDHRTRASELRAHLGELITHLAALIPSPTERAIYAPLLNAAEDALAILETRAPLFAANRSFFAKLSVAQAISRRTARNTLKALGLPVDRANAEAACTAAGKERALRRARTDYKSLRLTLELKADVSDLSAEDLKAEAEKLAAWLDFAIDVASNILGCPWSGLLWNELNSKDDDWTRAFARIAAAEDLLRATQKANAVFTSLIFWLEPNWLEARYNELKRQRLLSIDFVVLFAALQRLAPYQLMRQSELSAPATAVFGALLPLREALSGFRLEDRRAAVEALIRREAAFAWAEELRKERPTLASPPAVIQGHVDQLRNCDENMRSLNQRLLGIIDSNKLAPVQRWSQIWQIGGVNAKRLRQVFELGRDLGLLAARPIWLVNPDVASRIFPLEPNLFDVVIFDEASQMRVENAVSALYRGKRAVISGDSKQLPPTNFFGSTVVDENDDTIIEEVVGEDADAESAETRKREKIANRRHIKDCQDLLALSQGVLPERPLQIHYRSTYRELIDFSNAAYYGGRLNVPVRRPASEVRRHKPIEVRRINGVYDRQCNKDEAQAVVDYLSDMWTRHGTNPPTAGVVTFNLKQAEIIDDALQNRASQDKAFKIALEREQARTSNGEDVSFFIRNLENVQGDERDVIVFSTTFGKDAQDRFKKSFGVLTQQGGERRLNVAVTRAKSKVVLITSTPTAEVSDFLGNSRGPTKARDYLQAYLRYAEQIHDGELDAATAQLRAFNGGDMYTEPPTRDSDIDALVKNIQAVLEEAGYKTVLMPIHDAFSVDVAVLNSQTGLYSLGVELDGPRHHVLTSAKARDIWRPKILERSGMQVHRVYSAAWASDQARERERLLRAARKSMERAET